MSHAMTPSRNEVKVRMYRQGLGDCFLLVFPGESAPFYMLIDCGVILGTPNAVPTMSKVAADIRATTGGTIDLLVATHEHWDHLSGYIQAGAVFQNIAVKNLWFAWTEDPTNALANKLRAERHKTVAALQMAIQRATNTSMDHVARLVEFFGDPLGVAGGSNTRAALEFLRGHGPAPRFCHPGEAPITLPGVPGVRLYVLGPPEDEKKIKQSDPTARGREVYDNSPALTAATAFLMAAHHGPTNGSELAPDDWELFDRSFPFDNRYRVPPETAAQSRFFQERYGFDPPTTPNATGTGTGSTRASKSSTAARASAPAWRRIDDDWLGVSEELALQLDSDTNNTSLALAIELVESGRVLLFPGDAQVGNWLSWHDLSWEIKENGTTRTVNALDLLARTVLYKVGHHGSHNATLRAKGLMMMTSPDLVAMVPVNHEMAVKKRWNMPFPPLRAALEEKTKGRLMLVDEGVPLRNGAAASSRLTEAEKTEFLRRVECQDTPADQSTVGYIEYTVAL